MLGDSTLVPMPAIARSAAAASTAWSSGPTPTIGGGMLIGIAAASTAADDTDRMESPRGPLRSSRRERDGLRIGGVVWVLRSEKEKGVPTESADDHDRIW